MTREGAPTFPQIAALRGTEGQNGETVAVPTALAMCKGPVLEQTKTFISAMTPASSRNPSFPIESQTRFDAENLFRPFR